LAALLVTSRETSNPNEDRELALELRCASPEGSGFTSSNSLSAKYPRSIRQPLFQFTSSRAATGLWSLRFADGGSLHGARAALYPPYWPTVTSFTPGKHMGFRSRQNWFANVSFCQRPGSMALETELVFSDRRHQSLVGHQRASHQWSYRNSKQ